MVDELLIHHVARLHKQMVMLQNTGQWIVTWTRLGNLGQVAPYVPVTGYNFKQRVRLKAQVGNSVFETLKNHNIWGIDEGPFCPCCPAGGLDLEKS